MCLSRDHSRQQYKTQIGSSRLFYCYRARLADVDQDTRMIERGGGEKGGGGSLALAKLQIAALVLVRYPKLHAKRHS